jgi:hypothetical protein
LDAGIYRVTLDGQWDLRDLHEFPHAYEQVYAFTYCFDSDLSPPDAGRIDRALESYPWRGGYSVVNIYTVLMSEVVFEHRPRIKSIQYASPGWIDLLLNLNPAIKLAASVMAITSSLAATAKACEAIQKTLHNIRTHRQKAQVEIIELTRQEIEQVHKLTQELSSLIKFDHLDALQKRTGSAEVTAKLIVAQYRRLKMLAEYVRNKKAGLPRQPWS